MMFAFGIFGIATASYLVLKCAGEIALEIRHEHYKKQRLAEEQFEQPPEVEDSPRASSRRLARGTAAEKIAIGLMRLVL